MKRILVAYFSLSGNTAKVAMDLSARTGADILQIRELRERRGFLGYVGAALDSLRERSSLLDELGKSAADYDLVLVGTPVWVGRITPAIRTYLTIIRGQVRRVGFFTTSGGTDVSRLVPEMQRLAGVDALASVGLTAPELRDTGLYRRKLDEFVAELGIATPAVTPLDEGVLEHAHA